MNGPTLEPTLELRAPAAPLMEQHHVRAWHVDLDAAAAVHEALVAAESEPTQPGVAIAAPILAPVAEAPLRVAPPPPPAAAPGVPTYAWGLAAVAAIGGLAAYLLG